MTESNGVGQGEQRAQSEAARLAYIEDRMAVVSTLSTMQRRFVVRYLLHGNVSAFGYVRRLVAQAHADASGYTLVAGHGVAAALERWHVATSQTPTLIDG